MINEKFVTAEQVRQMIHDCINHDNRCHDTMFFDRDNHYWFFASANRDVSKYITLLDYMDINLIQSVNYNDIVNLAEGTIYFRLIRNDIPVRFSFGEAVHFCKEPFPNQEKLVSNNTKIEEHKVDISLSDTDKDISLKSINLILNIRSGEK